MWHLPFSLINRLNKTDFAVGFIHWMSYFQTNPLSDYVDIYLRPKVTLHCVYTYIFLVFMRDKKKLFDSY